MSVTVEIVKDLHQHPLPRGMIRLLTRLAELVGLRGHRQVKHGMGIKGTPHTQGVVVGRICRDSTIELQCQPRGNETRRLMFFLLRGAESPEKMQARFERAAARLKEPERRRIKKKAPTRISFRELIARAKPEGGKRMEERDTGAPAAQAVGATGKSSGEGRPAPPAQNGPTLSGADEQVGNAVDATGVAPLDAKRFDNPAWVLGFVERFLGATGGAPQMAASQLSPSVLQSLHPGLSSMRLRGCVRALCDRGVIRRVCRHNDPKKDVVAYELAPRAMEMVKGTPTCSSVNEKDEREKKRLVRLARLEELARPALECEAHIEECESELVRLEKETDSWRELCNQYEKEQSRLPEEARRAREMLRFLDGEKAELDTGCPTDYIPVDQGGPTYLSQDPSTGEEE